MPAGTPTFRGQATEVIVPVTVTDDKGKFVSNLVARDFQILDEGRPQRIKFFSHDQKQPIVVGFLVDQSNNMRIHWSKYQDAIMELVWNLLPGDPRYRGYLITYGNDAELLVNTTQNSEPIVDKVRKMKPGGGAALYDAIYKACTNRQLVNGEPYEPRRVLIIDDPRSDVRLRAVGRAGEVDRAAPGESPDHRFGPGKAGLSTDKAYVNIDRYGNTSAASIPIALDDAHKAGLVQMR